MLTIKDFERGGRSATHRATESLLGGIAMKDADLAFSPVWRLRELLDNRAVSSVELTELFLRRIEALNPQLNALMGSAKYYSLPAASGLVWGFS